MQKPMTYEGRPLANPAEEIFDQGLTFDLQTLIGRRQVLNNEVYATAGYEQSVANMQRVGLTTDMVFGEDAGARQLGTVTGSLEAGFTVELPCR